MARRNQTAGSALPTQAEAGEAYYLGQKRRLSYLLRVYAPPYLRPAHLARRLMLTNAFGEREDAAASETAFHRKLKKDGKRALPANLHAGVTADAFEQWLLLPGARNYRKDKGFDVKLCSALGWVLADECPAGRLSDEEFDEKREQIAKFIRSGFPQPAAIFEGLDRKVAEEVLGGVALPDQDLEARYLRGVTPPGLSIAAGDATIARRIEPEILAAITEPDCRAVLVTGSAGDGKSTLLYRLALQLSERGWRVLFKHERLEDFAFNWPVGQEPLRPTVVFIDRMEDMAALGGLPAWLDNNPYLKVVVAARSIDWERGRRGASSNVFRRFELSRLSDGEIVDFADLLVRKNVSHVADRSEVEASLRASIHNSEHPHMLAAAMTACAGADYRRVLAQMIDDFPESELLRIVALCSVSKLGERDIYCTGAIMAALHCDTSEPLAIGKRKFAAIHEVVRSEILRIHGDLFDLRHPDIAKFVLCHSYDADDSDRLKDTSTLIEDWRRLFAAIGRVYAEERDPNVLRRYRFMLKGLPACWWSPDWLPPNSDIGRRMFDLALDQIGFADPTTRSLVLDQWHSLEKSALETDPEAAESYERLLPELAEAWSRQVALLAGRNTDQGAAAFISLRSAYDRWLRFAMTQHGLGSLEDPEPGTVRAVLRRAWATNDGCLRAFILMGFKTYDSTDEGIGDFEKPKPFTYRQLARETWRTTPHWVALDYWADIELRAGKIGAPNQEFTARWLYANAWLPIHRRVLCTPYILTRWALMEVQATKQLGSFEQFGSPRWIFYQAWQDWLNPDADQRLGLCNSTLMTEWANSEADDEIRRGGQLASHEYSARWILFECWSRRKEEGRPSLCTHQLMRTWAQTEAAHGNLGDMTTERSARWVLRTALDELGDDRELLRSWATIEFRAGNFGKYGDPEPYTMRWLAERAVTLFGPDWGPLYYLACAAAVDGHLGDFDAPVEGTARNLFRQMSGDKHHKAWARAEVQAPDFESTRHKPFGADWIFARTSDNVARHASVEEWVALEVAPDEEPAV